MVHAHARRTCCSLSAHAQYTLPAGCSCDATSRWTMTAESYGVPSFVGAGLQHRHHPPLFIARTSDKNKRGPVAALVMSLPLPQPGTAGAAGAGCGLDGGFLTWADRDRLRHCLPTSPGGRPVVMNERGPIRDRDRLLSADGLISAAVRSNAIMWSVLCDDIRHAVS